LHLTRKNKSIMTRFLIKNTSIVNEGQIHTGDVLIEDKRIAKISQVIDNKYNAIEINGEGKFSCQA
jgi:dihydroorotase